MVMIPACHHSQEPQAVWVRFPVEEIVFFFLLLGLIFLVLWAGIKRSSWIEYKLKRIAYLLSRKPQTLRVAAGQTGIAATALPQSRVLWCGAWATIAPGVAEFRARSADRKIGWQQTSQLITISPQIWLNSSSFIITELLTPLRHLPNPSTNLRPCNWPPGSPDCLLKFRNSLPAPTTQSLLQN